LLMILIWFVLPNFKEFTWVDRAIAIFLVVCSDIILVLEIGGLAGLLKYPALILGIQALILLGLFFYNKSRGIKISKPTFPKRLGKSSSRFAGVTIVVAVFLTIIYGFLAYLQFRFPQSNSDSLYNHLSRIGFWMQQGSLNHYFSFIDVGTTFPYNNSLLMLWSVEFLRSDMLVGMVQFVALGLLALTIYALAVELGFSKKGSILAALFFLTFPIIALESITAQNDILLAAFLVPAFYFLLKFSHLPRTDYLIFSLLAFALAVGTKQHALFAMLGYAVVFLWVVIKHRGNCKKILTTTLITTVLTVLLFGSYAYIQNWIVLRSPVGSKIFSGDTLAQQDGSFLQKATINSSRLLTQFIGCDGLPPTWESKCIDLKAAALRPVFRKTESQVFLLEKDAPFSLDTKYLLNEESAWFGPQSWLVILPTLVIAIIVSIKQKKPAIILFIIAAVIYWVWTSAIKPGWDPYVGRYLIAAVALVTPFTAVIFGNNKRLVKGITTLVMAISLFTLSYAILNNDSRPLTSRTQLLNLEVWGKDHSKLVQKIAYKLAPFVRHEYDVWNEDEISIRTFSWGALKPLFYAIDKFIPQKSVLVILHSEGMFPDYLLFGSSFDRELIELIDINELKNIQAPNYYLITGPDYKDTNFMEFESIYRIGEWSIYRK
jgi:hypothetical protein